MSAPNAGPLEDLDGQGSPAQAAQIGAFFDVDGTLVDGFIATIHAAHRFRQRQAAFGELTGILEASVRYKFGRMEFERLLVRASGYLRGESLAEQELLGEDLFHSRVLARVFPTMREVVRSHQNSGHTVVLSSSGLTIHVMPLARYLGIEHVICNQFTADGDGTLTGDIVRPIVWGHRKAAAVQEFSDANGIDLQQSYFYADGDEDLPLMRVVGHPIPVNPRRGLAAEADRLGWTVVRAAAPTRVGLLRRLAGCG